MDIQRIEMPLFAIVNIEDLSYVFINEYELRTLMIDVVKGSIDHKSFYILENGNKHTMDERGIIDNAEGLCCEGLSVMTDLKMELLKLKNKLNLNTDGKIGLLS